jgi:hypothetical protein
MGFDGEPFVGRLQKVTPTHPPELIGERGLGSERTQVLDY